MPIDRYFGGHGEKVMASMKRQYGEKEGESVFYATANKKGQKPGDDEHMKGMKSKMKSKMKKMHGKGKGKMPAFMAKDQAAALRSGAA